MFVLDTNVLSELRQPRRSNPRVLAWAASQAVAAQFVSAITLLELELGVLQQERKDAAKGAVLRAWLDGKVLSQFAGRILPLDMAVALRCAQLHVPDRAGREALIAATALVHGMTIVTRNVADFASTGAPVINPWEVR